MKKLLMLFIAACGSVSAIAQGPNSHDQPDSLVSRWVIDVNLLGGVASQTFTTANSNANYLNGLNLNTGQLKYSNGSSFGGDAQLGFFFGKKRHFGIGTGFMYMQQQGTASLNNYHVEYQATDGNGNIYRQVVTGNNINETVNSSNINIPLVLKYKTRFSKHWGFSTDAGALLNLQMNNAYTTNANFDYEAIYKLEQSSDAGTISVYDNSPTASANDWFITKKEFLQNNPTGNYQDYLNAKRALGFNVGEGLTPNTTKGNTSYTMGSVGLMVQPSINYYVSDYIALNFGVYYMVQPFKNNAQSNYTLTDGIGTYSSVLNDVTKSVNQTYGLNIGARFFFGRKDHAPLVISSIDATSPSQCSLCDGSMAIHGLTPNKEVTIGYSLNGAAPTNNATTVDGAGDVKIANLCSGNYTGITATIKKKNAAGQPVTLTDPVVHISGQNTANPTLKGVSDGSVVFNGLPAGKSVTINYNLNGTAAVSFTSVVNPDNTVKISGLCEGTYTGIVASVNHCAANGADFTLVAPVPPPPPPPPPVVVADKIDISAPILFEVNKFVVHSSSYPEIEEAATEMKENKSLYLTIDGNADASGNEPANRVLSLNRANAVKTQLTKRGVNPKRLKTKGHGSSIPAATNSTEDGKRQNRRAVMSITPDKK